MTTLLLILLALDGGSRPVPLEAPLKPAALSPMQERSDVGPRGTGGSADGGTNPAALTTEVKQLVDRVQAFYEKSSDFSAGFKQEYTYKAFKRTTVSSGTVLYKRGEKGPKMRWDYEKPEPKSFVLADEKVRLLDPSAMTLTLSAMATDKLSASVSFLWGQGKLQSEFSIVEKACSSCAGVLLELTPLRPDPRFRQVLLEVDRKTATVLKSTVVDPDGSQNAISFLNLKANIGVKDEQFVLTPAKGTQIIDLTAGLRPAANRDAGT